jgi:hypothetical protein
MTVSSYLFSKRLGISAAVFKVTVTPAHMWHRGSVTLSGYQWSNTSFKIESRVKNGWRTGRTESNNEIKGYSVVSLKKHQNC